MQPTDAKRIYMVMTVNPDAQKTTARFNNQALYVFHTTALASPADQSPAPEIKIICRFDNNVPQNVECWAGSGTAEYVKGALDTKLITKSANMYVEAGVRNDPYFLNQTAVDSSIASLGPIYKAGARDAAGCLAFTALQQPVALKPVAAQADTYKTKNVLAIALSMDTAFLTQTGKTLISVWASTNKSL